MYEIVQYFFEMFRYIEVFQLGYKQLFI